MEKKKLNKKVFITTRCWTFHMWFWQNNLRAMSNYLMP